MSNCLTSLASGTTVTAGGRRGAGGRSSARLASTTERNSSAWPPRSGCVTITRDRKAASISVLVAAALTPNNRRAQA